mmetsp:Transcript_90225/g.160700  ORF Transcript_90225/g.160700 Transcript_90225/m.160700 type:complete len:415 (+) Transcript_90225:65-1309(+)|eukprot:CAMPEP_0197664562 /NCGR_PEP_ID=MMETSP1338-20131121/58714_1 /TAXON_ID=43686 ORGANISM="Pelagodinium beii, Strain RCC1491" /NCGR_SAMPLE_ID=MMETSP1338 /ASSEMBLY_ACC=CAM_ASM_000754 /LENGTH=414 /DNA_ID=CAMNT_0043243233 /DNA_START=53 /DNA_END=1297 /DNA_ORIENTATION=+
MTGGRHVTEVDSCVYQKELLLVVRSFMDLKGDSSDAAVCPVSRVLPPRSPRSPCPTPRNLEAPASPEPTLKSSEASFPSPSTAASVTASDSDDFCIASWNSLSEDLEKEIQAAQAAAQAALSAAPPESSWGKDAHYSQLLTRLRRASGYSLPLATLRREAPRELRFVMKDGEAFATWLSHRTGLVEVQGPPGQEQVVLHQSAHRRKFNFEFDPEATEFSPVAGSTNFSFDPDAADFNFAEFNFDPTASEFYYDHQYAADVDMEALAMDWTGAGMEDPSAMAYGSDHLTVAEAHELLLSSKMAGFGDQMSVPAFRPPPGLSSEEEPSVAPAEAGLNPEAAEFRPVLSLAEYGKVRKLGSKSKLKHKAASNLPEAIPEEPITGSSETASGDEEPSEDSVSIFEEESVLNALAPALT